MFNLREAELKDIEVIASFQVKMAWETEKYELNFNNVLKGVEAVFYDSNKGKYYVVEYENNIIACVLITYEWSDWRNGIVLWIHSLYVEKEYRKKGVFRMIYNYIKEMVNNNKNFKGIRLYVDRSNVDAINVYTKIGMRGDHYKLFEWMKE